MERQRVEPAYTLAAAFAASMALAAVLGNERVPAIVATAVFGAVVAAVAARSQPFAAVAGAVVAWSMLTGFAVNRLGALSLHVGDLGRLGVLVAAALVGSSLARLLGRRLDRVDPVHPAVPSPRPRVPVRR